MVSMSTIISLDNYRCEKYCKFNATKYKALPEEIILIITSVLYSLIIKHRVKYITFLVKEV